MHAVTTQHSVNRNHRAEKLQSAGRLPVYILASGSFHRGSPSRSHDSCQDFPKSPSHHMFELPRPDTPSSLAPVETDRLVPRLTSSRQLLLRHPRHQGPVERAVMLVVA